MNKDCFQSFFILINYLSIDMKEVFITNKQYDIIKNFLNEDSKPPIPTPQDQVKNHINAGIMDAITCGGMCEGAEPEADKYYIGMENNSNFEYGHVNENINNSEYEPYIKSMFDYFKSEGLNIYPYPKIELDNSPQDGLFIKTGYYLPSEKKIVIFTQERHIKDCMRSIAHELIHHMQNLEGENMNFGSEDNVKDNKALEKLEAEAYLKGNIYFRKWTEFEQEKNKNVLSERILSKSELRELTKELDEGERWTIYAPVVDESLSPEEVDLSSFNIKKNLNPKFWKDGKLDSRIRMKLLDIADDFIEFLGVNWVKPKDIIITGSLANFNWNEKYSDIDLHILLDYSKVDKRKDFVSNYFYALKKQWNEEHEDLKIFGFPVEVYVQDVNETHTASGVYSLEKNEWIEEPERNRLAKVKVNKNTIKNEVSKYTIEIDNLVTSYEKNKDDKYHLEKISNKAEKLFDKIKTERRKSLNDKNTEINEPNIIFKTLRRLGYIEKLINVISDTYNKMNSLP